MNILETLILMKQSADTVSTILLFFSMPNFFSSVGIALAIINQLYRMSEGVVKEGGFKPYFNKMIFPFASKWKELVQKFKAWERKRKNGNS